MDRTVGTHVESTSREWKYRGKRRRQQAGKSACRAGGVTRSELK